MRIDKSNIKQRFENVFRRFCRFLHERDWESYHHPKESSFNLAVEYMELLELFQNEPLEATNPDLLDEIGDVCASFCLLGYKLSIDLDRLESACASLETTRSPLLLVLQLGARIGTIMENFQWISDEASRSMKSHEVANKSFIEGFSTFLQLANKLGVDPFEAALQKLEKTSQKYPIGEKHQFVKGHLNVKIMKRLQKLSVNP